MRGRQTLLVCILGAAGIVAVALLGRRSEPGPIAAGPPVPPLSKEQIKAAGEAGVEPVIEIDLGGGVMMKMVLIPAGTFTMGSPVNEKGRGDDEIQHEVTLTKPFYMGMTEVTRGQWEAVMGTRPWEDWKYVGYAKADPTHTADYVSWIDCHVFLRKLNAKVRRSGFRLPTEAEWEYACRAGSTTRFYYGDDPDNSQLGRYAWYRGNADSIGEKYPHAVGTKQLNRYGLYDMHGNVTESSQDWYGDYPPGRATDPTGPGTGTYRVLRGGHWANGPGDCLSARRNRTKPTTSGIVDGFRISRTLLPSAP